MKHLMLCGEIGVGKSTLIQRLLNLTARPIYGYKTKIMTRRDDGFHEIYIFRGGDEEMTCSEKNHLADCDSHHHMVNAQLFETLGAPYIREGRADGVILMDELGFMERDSEGFVSAVLDALEGNIPVIGAVKAGHEDVEFLNRIKQHPNVDLYTVTRENRDELYKELRPVAEALFRGGIGQV